MPIIAKPITDSAAHGRIAISLARAFQNEEACSFIFPDPQVRARRLIAMFRVMIAGDAAAGRIFATAGGEAVTLWRSPGRARASRSEFAASAFPFLCALGPGIGRGLKVSGQIEKHYPDTPFHYLHFAGCIPEQQGRGFGAAAIRAGLAQADADHLPAYLETASEGNIGLYRSLGFELTAQWHVSRDLPFWGMLRPAR